LSNKVYHSPSHGVLVRVCADWLASIEKETLVGFGCGHIYHVSYLQDDGEDQTSGEERRSIDSSRELDEDTAPYFSRTVGLKVTNARLLRDKVGSGCRICALKPADEEE
jgi:hypothetical protein